MLNILFWNLNRKKNTEHIISCIVENDVDIAVFAEFREKDGNSMVIETAAIEHGLGDMYAWISGVEADGKVILLAKKSVGEVRKIQQDDRSRYSLYIVNTPMKSYILAAVHLEDRLSDPYSASRKKTIKRLVSEIKSNEEILRIKNTIVIGDFNANPYDEELLDKDAFNAVLFKTIIKANEFTSPEGDRIERFYNPIIHYLSESTEMYGSHYYDGSTKHWTPYWHCLDQVLVRKNLVDLIQEIKYLKRIGDKSLLNRAKKPNEKISDHLPLLVTLLEVEDGT